MNDNNHTLTSNEQAIATKPTQSAVIVRVRWSFMEGRMTNKQASVDLAKLKDADADSITTSQRIIKPEMLRPLRQIRSATNKYIKANTHPWDDNGGRLLPSKKVTEYLSFMAIQKEKFESAKRDLRGLYDLIIDDAKNRLNGMFDPKTFPTMEEWLDKYDVRLEMETISDSDARLDNVDSKVMQEIQSQVEQNVSNRLKEANRNNYIRIIESLEKLVGRLQAMESGEAERFRTSTYDTVVEILDTAEGLNFADDKVLEKLIKQTKKTFAESCGNLPELKADAGEPNPKRQNAVGNLKNAVADLMANLPS